MGALEQETVLKKSEKIKEYFERGVLISKEMLDSNINAVSIMSDSVVLTKQQSSKNKNGQIQNGQIQTHEIITSYENEPRKYIVDDFTNIFVSRYKFFENILKTRNELTALSSISKILAKRERETNSIIAIISKISETKAGNYILKCEDLTGEMNVIVSKKKKGLIQKARDLVVDEIIGVNGSVGDNVLFAEQIIWPDLPYKDLKKADEEIYAIFISDMHVGSQYFLEEEFNRFLRWINGELGDERQKSMASKVKYLFIAGDIVDGVGVYPSQEKELTITDINDQYEEAARLLRRIPPNIQIIMCPGNHDAVHLAEPQPIFDKKFSSLLYNMDNVQFVSNPAVVNIGKKTDFPGFDVLMYHGYSFDYYVANVNSLRMKGGYKRGDLIMRYLLQRRHLAPSFTSTPYVPSHKEDPLLIKTIPDFFISGHIHYSVAGNYKNTTLISGSCWQDITSFQEKLGHEPEPARVPIVNLKTREIKMLKFM